MPVTRVNPESLALLVIDVQERLIPTIVDAQRVIANSAILVRLAGEFGIPYMVTEQYPNGLGRTVAPITDAMADPSNRIEKTRFSAMVDLVEDHLQETKSNSVVICGIEAHVCVLQTVLDLHASGRQCFVCVDAVSASQRDQIPLAYQRMRDAGAILTGCMSLMYEMLGDARHPSFKACLEFAKAIEQ